MEENNNTPEQTDKEQTKERNILVLCVFGAMIWSFVPALIAWLIKKDSLSEYADTALKRNLSFELILCIIVTLVSMVPVINLLSFLVVPAAIIFNVIACISAYIAIDKHEDYVYPVPVELIK